MSEFSERLYALCREIPVGMVSTYRELAVALNSSPRAVGQALRCNPYAPMVPCHRVVKSDGSIGGFMGEVQGEEIKRKVGLLFSEGILINDGKVAFFNEKLYKFNKEGAR